LDRAGDWPIGIAYEASIAGPLPSYQGVAPEPVRSFAELPCDMHDEQRAFLHHIGVRSSATRSSGHRI
ncbi:MAG TPA: hypothetical protein VE991_03425, partial [Acidimicrobiales bacterium]|nr:hypothetical protein [Acidimicrobiales bacterium]